MAHTVDGKLAQSEAQGWASFLIDLQTVLPFVNSFTKTTNKI